MEYKVKGNNGIKNIFCDFIFLIIFVIIIFICKREFEVLKFFMDDVVYGFSDSVKVFIIILLIDMFVGFYFFYGWEVILENIIRYFGLLESRDFNFLFIVIFLVILDVVFKYWIFCYLNCSLSFVVVIYKNMNE